MYIIILSKQSEGWADLTSVIGFITIAGIGIVVGIIVEIVNWIVKRNKNI